MWYKILKVDSKASKDEIENAYRTLSNDPRIVNDMKKSFELRQAYLEGMKQVDTNQSSVNATHYQSLSNIQPNKSNKSSKTVIIVIVVIFVIATIILGVLFSFVDNISNYSSTKASMFDNEVLNCISNTYDDDINVSNDVLEEELENAGYKIDEIRHVKDYKYIAHKQLDEYVIIIEVSDIGNPRCEMSVNYEVDAFELVEEEEESATLIGKVSPAHFFFDNEESSFYLEYYYHTTYPVNSIEEVAFKYYDLKYDEEDDIKFYTSDDNQELIKKYNELIPIEYLLEMVEVLEIEIDTLK